MVVVRLLEKPVNKSASRELFEELGIHYNFEQIRPQFTINFERGFNDYYLIEYDVNLNELTLQSDEVQAIKWASKEEIIALINQKNLFLIMKALLRTYLKDDIIMALFVSKGKFIDYFSLLIKNAPIPYAYST